MGFTGAGNSTLSFYRIRIISLRSKPRWYQPRTTSIRSPSMVKQFSNVSSDVIMTPDLRSRSEEPNIQFHVVPFLCLGTVRFASEKEAKLKRQGSIQAFCSPGFSAVGQVNRLVDRSDDSESDFFVQSQRPGVMGSNFQGNEFEPRCGKT